MRTSKWTRLAARIAVWSGVSLCVHSAHATPPRAVRPIARQFSPNRISRDDRAADAVPASARGLFASARVGTTVLAAYEFDAGGGCSAQGWTSHDLTEQLPGGFHVDDFSGWNVFSPLQGNHSLWCGVWGTETPELCVEPCLPGYARNWDKWWQTRNCLTVTGDVTVSFKARWVLDGPAIGTPPDGLVVEYQSGCGGPWIAAPGVGPSGFHLTNVSVSPPVQVVTVTIPAGLAGNSVRIRLRFVSDDYVTTLACPAGVVIDSLSVRDAGGIVLPVETFESAPLGATATNDWFASEPAPYGDFAGLFPGTSVFQEDPCVSNLSCLWGFFNGSTANYACGGFPSQLAVPYGNTRGQYLHNAVRSPWIPLIGTGSEFSLQFDVYRDLPLDGLVFYFWQVRSKCPSPCGITPWYDHNYVYYWDDKRWHRFTESFGDLVGGGATDIQIQLGAIDMCGVWCGILGTGSCHSHAPLFDNVTVYRVTDHISWNVSPEHLAQDAFPDDGTRTGTAQVNMALDLLPPGNPAIRPGDSLVATATSLWGFTTDPFLRPAVYAFVRCSNPSKTGWMLSDDPVRWPVVGTPVIGGDTWTQILVDTVDVSRFGNSPPCGAASTWTSYRFCVDFNDNLFVPGDVVWYFFGAQDGAGTWSYWTRGLGDQTQSIGDAAAFSMEFSVLPSPDHCVLYVDGADGTGVQPFFDTVFQQMNVKVDRYDINAPSAHVGNRPGSGLAPGAGGTVPAGVKDPLVQLAPYNTIIWSTGELSSGLIGDGSGLPEKSDDATMLFQYLDQLAIWWGAQRVYFSGDNIAEEWQSGTGYAGSGPSLYGYITHTLVSGDYHGSGGAISPLVIGVGGGDFDHIATGPDTLIAYGGQGCTPLADFDVVAPTGTATLEMTYEDGRGAVIGQLTTNSVGADVQVYLSGFSFHRIRDDRPTGILDRAHHLSHIVACGGGMPNGAGETLPVTSLGQNYPNPFNPTTSIPFTVARRGPVSLAIYDVSGHLVRTLVSGVVPPGEHVARWEGRNRSGQPVASGVYYCRLKASGKTWTRRMVLLR